jgi:hypothetical protein
MSHVALRRVMVRLLHDPRFVDALYADPARALADVDLTRAERDWLVATPRAAWGTDPERPARVLAALRDEYPVATALAPEHAQEFFASAPFHTAVQARGSLALALGDHLAAGLDRAAASVAVVERAIAAVRRAPARRRAAATVDEPTERAILRLAPHAALVQVPAGTLDVLTAVRAGTPPPALGDGEDAVLVLRDGDGATVEALPDALASLLAATPLGRDDLCALARRLGAEPGEDADIVDGLVRDGILV